MCFGNKDTGFWRELAIEKLKIGRRAHISGRATQSVFMALFPPARVFFEARSAAMLFE
jgi:hypothetical protein